MGRKKCARFPFILDVRFYGQDLVSFQLLLVPQIFAINLLDRRTAGDIGEGPDVTPSATYPPAIKVDSKYNLEGIASWYTMGNGTRTANGEIYDAYGSWSCGWTAAHKKLPFNTIVRVKKSDGAWIVVRINDRGPYVNGRIIDLTERANRALKMDGIAKVKLEVIKMGDGKQFHHYSKARAKEVVKGWNDIMNAYNGIGNTAVVADNNGANDNDQVSADGTGSPSLDTYSPDIRPSTNASASERAFDVCKVIQSLDTGGTLSKESAKTLQQTIKDLGFDPGPIDGIVGRRTLSGAKKVRTFLAQSYLKRLGHDPGPLDGIIGPKTRAALQSYYADSSQTGSGDIDLQLIEKLRAADTDSVTVTD